MIYPENFDWVSVQGYHALKFLSVPLSKSNTSQVKELLRQNSHLSLAGQSGHRTFYINSRDQEFKNSLRKVQMFLTIIHSHPKIYADVLEASRIKSCVEPLAELLLDFYYFVALGYRPILEASLYIRSNPSVFFPMADTLSDTRESLDLKKQSDHVDEWTGSVLIVEKIEFIWEKIAPKVAVTFEKPEKFSEEFYRSCCHLRINLLRRALTPIYVGSSRERILFDLAIIDKFESK
jgi:hypothetical protein